METIFILNCEKKNIILDKLLIYFNNNILFIDPNN